MHKVLLVDDSRAALSALKERFDPNLYLVSTTQSPLAVLGLLAQSLPDVILSDYEMPDIDGPGLCKIIKSDERFKHVPLIILTSLTDTSYLLTALAAGADDFVPKDSDVRIVIAKIQAMLRMRHAQEELAQLRRVAGIKQIVATYNHEFNNPLAIAIGNLSYLRSSLTDEGQLARAQRAFDALERMAVIVRKIRDLRDYVEVSYSSREGMVSLKASTG